MPEVTKPALQAILAIIEANANFLYIFQLKFLGNRWEMISKTAKATSEKLYKAVNLL